MLLDNREDNESRGGINAKVLEWAREQAAYLPSEVARMLNISESTILEWEEGSKQPEIDSLRALSLIYDTPFSYFFLSRLPRVIPLQDYRGTPKEIRKKLSQETKRTLREFRRLHRFSRILWNLTKMDSKQDLDFVSGREDIEEVASRERKRLGITTNGKKEWVNKQYAWQKWRDAIEGLGISVFSLHMPPLECRGAAISEKPYSILVNRNDSPAGKSFTLLHEYYHLLLRAGDNLFLCDSFPSSTESNPNQFASLVLLSNQEFLDGLKESNVQGYREFWSDPILDDLSKRFLVSRDVVAIRLEQLGYAPEGFYAARRLHWESSYKDYTGFRLGGMTKRGHAREKVGDLTLSLTFRAVNLGFISVVDAASYLGEVRGSRTGSAWNVTVSDIDKWMREV
jgi:Zn-dependent peptidase ImmA (M78 family)/DNA-binding XRE family transcriptional regulator